MERGSSGSCVGGEVSAVSNGSFEVSGKTEGHIWYFGPFRPPREIYGRVGAWVGCVRVKMWHFGSTVYRLSNLGFIVKSD